MAIKSTYLSEIKELTEAYGIEALAKILKKTTRGIQYWSAEMNPKKPGPATQRTIHELFVKYKNGEDLQFSEKSDYKEKYIQSLQENNKHLKDQLSLMKDKFVEQLLLTQAKVQTNQAAIADLLVKQKIGTNYEIEDRLSIDNVKNYQKLKVEFGIP